MIYRRFSYFQWFTNKADTCSFMVTEKNASNFGKLMKQFHYFYEQKVRITNNL